MSEFYQQFFCPEDNHYSIIIEDNGKVSYAYLLNGKNIISDVWLYNQHKTPKTINWNDKEYLPFLNPEEYVLDDVIITPITNDFDIELDWIYESDLKEVKIHLKSKLVAILKPNFFPGFSLLVCKDGPLAKKLQLSQEEQERCNIDVY